MVVVAVETLRAGGPPGQREFADARPCGRERAAPLYVKHRAAGMLDGRVREDGEMMISSLK